MPYSFNQDEKDSLLMGGVAGKPESRFRPDLTTFEMMS
jgi:hypothetical protein